MAAPTIKDRAGSFDSSSTRSPTMYEANEKLAQFYDDEEKLLSPDELEAGFNDDDEDRTLLSQTPQGDQSPSPPTQTSFTTAILWMVANTLATIGIVRRPPPHLSPTTNPPRSSPTKPSSPTPASSSPSSPSPPSTSPSPSSPSSPSRGAPSRSSSRAAPPSARSSPSPSPWPSTSSCQTFPSPIPP